MTGGVGAADVRAISDLLAGFSPGAGGAVSAPASQGHHNSGMLEGTPGTVDWLVDLVFYVPLNN